MTSLTDTQVVTASGGLVELGYAQTTSATTITSTSASSPTAIVSVTFVADGSPVLVEAFSPLVANVGTISVGDYCDWALQQDGSPLLYVWWRGMANTTGYNQRGNYASYRYTPSAGSHTLTFGGVSQTAGSRWSVGGAGIGVAPTYLRVSKIVEATQWPAVTTGSIICTSSTRPASPFEGQQIYETDTNLEYTYDGSAWKVRSRDISFAAYGTSYQGATSGFYNFVFDIESFDNGSCYNTSTGAFTAPVDGVYHFDLNCRLDSTPAGGYLRAYIYRNGTTQWSAPNLHNIFGGAHSTDYHSFNVSGLMSLTAGQVVYPGGGHVSGSSNLLRAESTFSGFWLRDA